MPRKVKIRFNPPVIPYVHTGYAVTFSRAYRMDAETGSFVHTFNDAAEDDIRAPVLNVEAGVFVHTFNDSSYNISYQFDVETGDFVHTFNDATNDLQLSQAFTMQAECGFFNHTFNDAELTQSAASYTLDAETGVFTHTGWGSVDTFVSGKGFLISARH